MSGFLLKWAVNIISLLVVLHTVPGIRADRFETAVVAALLLGLINVFLKPIVILLTLPLNILTLGFFTLIINGLMLYLVSKLVPGFNIAGFWNAFWGALVFSIISFLLNLYINPEGRIRAQFYRYRAPRAEKYDRVIDVEGRVENKDGAK
jgi:putative membrane protein